MSSLHGYVFRSPDPAYCMECGEECMAVQSDTLSIPVSDCCDAPCSHDEYGMLEIDLDDCMDFE